jgi:PhzF family phenazine biosynthesis protein
MAKSSKTGPVGQPQTLAVEVFVSGQPGGRQSGNPASVTLDADGMSTAAMQALAEREGHEAAFALQPTNAELADIRFRFFTPRHEMEMCGHGALGIAWALAQAGRLKAGDIRVETLAGIIHVRIADSGAVALSQPRGIVEHVPLAQRAEVLDVLGVSEAQTLHLPIVNASTARVKTLVPLASPMVVNALTPDFARMEALCARLGSTGLYPFACDWEDERTYHARQFPRAAGFPEDAATGIAASALFYGLKHFGLVGLRKTIRIRQGEAMGRPSRIAVTLADGRDPTIGCWLTGEVRHAPLAAAA